MSLRILYVDDEADIREIALLSLGLDDEFEVLGCGSGADALSIAAEWHPVLILLDVMMPGMDGPATLAALGADPSTSAIPVVFITARTQARDLAHFRSLRAAGIISKPFDPMTLAAQVRAFL
ncbi:MAG: response regulator [Allosphingosinicella sp.]